MEFVQIIIAITAVFTAWLKWEEHKREEEKYGRRSSSYYSSSYRSTSKCALVLFWILWVPITWFIFGFVVTGIFYGAPGVGVWLGLTFGPVFSFYTGKCMIDKFG